MEVALSFLHQHGSPLGELLERFLEGLHLPPPWVEFLTHFVMDGINLLLILCVVMFGISLLQSYIPLDRLRRRLSALGSFWGYALSILLGVFSPFCSCTVIPVVMGLLAVGVPPAIALCYLTSAALLNVGAVVALFSSLGALFGGWYVALSLALAVGVSLLLGRWTGPDQVVSHSGEGHRHGRRHAHEHPEGCACQREESHVRRALGGMLEVLRETWLLMLLSVALASAVVSFVPMDLLQAAIGRGNRLAPLLGGVLGAPIHADAFGILPLLKLLRSVNPAAAMAFALGTMSISVPEALMLTRAFHTKTVLRYSLLLAAGSVLAGYLLLAVTM